MASGDRGAEWKHYCYCSTSNKNMQFVIKLQHSGDGKQSDIAIDDIEVVNMDCGELIMFPNFTEWFSLNSSKTTELKVIKLCMRQLYQTYSASQKWLVFDAVSQFALSSKCVRSSRVSSWLTVVNSHHFNNCQVQ